MSYLMAFDRSGTTTLFWQTGEQSAIQKSYAISTATVPAARMWLLPVVTRGGDVYFGTTSRRADSRFRVRERVGHHLL